MGPKAVIDGGGAKGKLRRPALRLRRRRSLASKGERIVEAE